MKPSVKVSLILSVLAAAAGAWVLYTYPPESVSFYPRCVFRAATGLQCPGCGTTRALHHLLHGRVAEAFRLNPMIFGVMGMFAVATPSFLRGESPRFVMKPWFAWTALLVVVGWGVLRNLF